MLQDELNENMSLPLFWEHSHIDMMAFWCDAINMNDSI